MTKYRLIDEGPEAGSLVQPPTVPGAATTHSAVTLAQIEAAIDLIGERAGKARPPSVSPSADPVADVEVLLGLGEAVLERWIEAKGSVPTRALKEGFRLLALQRQGAKGDPSFNACRETCRELVYHRNLILGVVESDRGAAVRALIMAVLVARHLCLFVAGKMQEAELGEFCCSSRPLRADADPVQT